MAYQPIPSASSATLNVVTTLTEEHIPLWRWTSYVSTSVTTAGSAFFAKGTNSTTTTTGTSIILYNHSSSYTFGQNFALEVTLWTTSGYTAYAELWDFTTSNVVSGSTVSTTNTNVATLAPRSSTFQLVPGHQYGIAIRSNSAPGTTHVHGAKLIALY